MARPSARVFSKTHIVASKDLPFSLHAARDGLVSDCNCLGALFVVIGIGFEKLLLSWTAAGILHGWQGFR